MNLTKEMKMDIIRASKFGIVMPDWMKNALGKFGAFNSEYTADLVWNYQKAEVVYSLLALDFVNEAKRALPWNAAQCKEFLFLVINKFGSIDDKIQTRYCSWSDNWSGTTLNAESLLNINKFCINAARTITKLGRYDALDVNQEQNISTFVFKAYEYFSMPAQTTEKANEVIQQFRHFAPEKVGTCRNNVEDIREFLIFHMGQGMPHAIPFRMSDFMDAILPEFPKYGYSYAFTPKALEEKAIEIGNKMSLYSNYTHLAKKEIADGMFNLWYHWVN